MRRQAKWALRVGTRCSLGAFSARLELRLALFCWGAFVLRGACREPAWETALISLGRKNRLSRQRLRHVLLKFVTYLHDSGGPLSISGTRNEAVRLHRDLVS